MPRFPPDPTRMAKPTWLEPNPDALLGEIVEAAAEPELVGRFPDA